MLLQFSVKNFRSFKDEQFITMVPAKIKGHEENIAHVAPKIDVLKSAVIYGANASGKSNFIKAISVLDKLIKNSSEKIIGETFSEYEPFKLSSSNQGKPIAFSIDILIDKIQYHYEVQILEESVKSERLSFFPHGREARLFERSEQDFIFGDYFKGPKKLLAEITTSNQLFLSKGALNNVKEFGKVVKFFQSNFLSTIYTDDSQKGILQISAYFLKRNDYLKNRVRNFINSLDIGISDFKIEDNMPGVDFIEGLKRKNNTVANNKFKFSTSHSYDNNKRNKQEVIFDIGDESDGTQKLFAISPIIFLALENGAILILDEFERSLHPHVSKFIINIFNNSEINKKGAQLIVATHDVTLLSESSNLRRDQIWIVEKNKQGASELFSLADMKGVRDNIPFEKWYMSGRFGGVPNIENLELEFDNAE